MTAHACTTLQPVGACYRCDLNRDEAQPIYRPGDIVLVSDDPTAPPFRAVVADPAYTNLSGVFVRTVDPDDSENVVAYHREVVTPVDEVETARAEAERLAHDRGDLTVLDCAACAVGEPFVHAYEQRTEDDEPEPDEPSAEQERAWDEQYDGTSLGA